MEHKFQGDTLQLHYWFNDKSHSIDALIQNKSEFELLGIFKEIAIVYGVEISIETEPTGNGGFIKWFKVILKNENKSAIITTSLMISVLTLALVTPLGKIGEKLIEKWFEDKEYIQIQKDVMRSEIRKNDSEVVRNLSEAKKNDSSIKQKGLNKERADQVRKNTNVVTKRVSNFYQSLNNYNKITMVSFVLVDDEKKTLGEEKFVYKEHFNDFILTSDTLEPIEIDNAIVEIVSPVLKKGNYKWRGIYNGEPILFNMNSKEFKALVQSGQIEFKSGSAIKCSLVIERKMNNEGVEQVTDYSIVRVNEYNIFIDPIETPESKLFRKKRDGLKQQTTIDFNKDINAN